MSQSFTLLLLLHISQVLAQICFPEQLEGLALLDYGDVFKAELDSPSEETTYSYTNGTVHISYDYTNLRLYLKVNATVFSSQPGQSGPLSRVYLQDYKKGLEYYVSDGKCSKSKLNNNMTRYCIPVDAKCSGILRVGIVGDGAFTANYEFETSDFMKVSLTVGPGCIPINVVYYSDTPPIPNAITYMYSLQFIDSRTGIMNSSVFDVPDACKGSTVNGQKTMTRPWMENILRPDWF